jgi:hypothetical protein
VSIKDEIAEILERLGISGHQLQNVKLGPGVVGRNSSIAWALEIVMLVGVVCGAVLRSPILIGLSLSGAIIVALAIAALNVHFGKANPGAALLEGAHFLQYHEMQLTAVRGGPAVPGGPPVPPPHELASNETKTLSNGSRTPEQ